MSFFNIILAGASGLLLAASFPTINLWFFAWIGLLPLFIALKRCTTRQAFWLGALAGIVYFAGTIYWVTHSIHFYGHIPMFIASGIMLLLAAYLSLYVGLFAAASVQVNKRYPSLFFLTAPAFWTAFELARTYVFSGFPWSLLGYSQYSVLPLVQIADVTGVYGISFLIVLVNASISQFLGDRKQFIGLAVSVAALATVLMYGVIKLKQETGGNGISVAVVQGNIEQDHKWDPAYQSQTFSIYKRLTLAASKSHPDLIIWPETATPFYFTGARESDRALSADLINFTKEHKTPLLFGSPTFEILPSRRIIASNSAFLLLGNGSPQGRYDKMHLVPFGEYVPMKDALFFLEKMVDAIGDFQAGAEYAVMTLPYQTSSGKVEAKVSTIICYEIIFPELVRQFAKRGANIITTITNDAWFGKTAAPYQHFSMAVFRAIENRVPIARAANTGISGFIDSKGRVLEASPIFTETFLTHSLSLGTERTFYTNYGDLFAYGCVILSLGLVIPFKRRPQSTK